MERVPKEESARLRHGIRWPTKLAVASDVTDLFACADAVSDTADHAAFGQTGDDKSGPIIQHLFLRGTVALVLVLSVQRGFGIGIDATGKDSRVDVML